MVRMWFACKLQILAYASRIWLFLFTYTEYFTSLFILKSKTLIQGSDLYWVSPRRKLSIAWLEVKIIPGTTKISRQETLLSLWDQPEKFQQKTFKYYWNFYVMRLRVRHNPTEMKGVSCPDISVVSGSFNTELKLIWVQTIGRFFL